MGNSPDIYSRQGLGISSKPKGPSINYIRTLGEVGGKSHIHFHCVLHAKRGEGSR